MIRCFALVCFDLRAALRSPTIWLYALVFAALGVLVTAVAGDAFEGLPTGGGLVKANAPYSVVVQIQSIGFVATVVISAVMGQAVHRDIKSRMYPLIFTTPLSKIAYLAGRFGAASAIMAGILAAIPLGLLAGTLIPSIPAARLLPFRIEAYVWGYLWLLPNLVWIGAVFFTLAAYSRTMLSNYLGGIVLVVGYALGTALLRDAPDHASLGALVDPFGSAPLRLATQYWPPADLNTRLPAVSGVLLANRVLWTSVGLAIAALCAWRFRFAQGGEQRWRGREDATPTSTHLPAPIPTGVVRDFGWTSAMRQAWAVLCQSCRALFASAYFPVILLVGLVYLLLAAGLAGRIYGTPTWPVTWQVLEVLHGAFALFSMIVIGCAAGELVGQERDHNTQQICDALPTPTVAVLLGKFGGLVVVVLLLQAVMVCAGVLTQLTQGFYDLRPALYLTVGFGIDLLDLLPIAVLAIAVHVLVAQKYAGHFVFLLIIAARTYLPRLGLEHHLYRYGEDPGWQYSDMNGFGPFLYAWGCFKAYWLAVAGALAIASVLFSLRGNDSAWRWRLRIARQRFGRSTLRTSAMVAGLVLLSGGWIYYNTAVVRPYRTEHAWQALAAAYERRYKAYEQLPQPRVESVDVACDLFGNEGRVRFTGRYQLVNRSDQPILEVHLLLPPEAEVAQLAFAPTARLTHEDKEQGYRIFTLDAPLAPGASLACAYDLEYRRRGFEPFTAVTDNGSFVTSGLMPSFGYAPKRELSDTDERRSFGLDPAPRMATSDDAQARRNHYVSRDADWIQFAATVSTDPDQIAVAPGRLEREWTAQGRRCFSYRATRPMLNFYSVLSARYASRKDAWNALPIEILYHPEHAYNLDTMMRAVKATLSYASAEFGPYELDHLRIAEFPRYGDFAQSFPGTIAFSEGLGFIARLDNATHSDYPFYITAHEVAHQWWAHQVIGANVQGATLLSETLAQYTALMVVEHTFGAAAARRLLRYELDSYLGGRTAERRSEPPLAQVEGQLYLHYHKGAVAMAALRDRLGEERMTAALRAFADSARGRSPPYPTSLELIAAFKAEAPAELHTFIDDLFLHVTLWDVRATSASCEPLPDGTWRVTITWSASKYRVGGQGHEDAVPLDLMVDMGVYGAAQMPGADLVPLIVEKRRVTSGPGSATFIVATRPIRADVDPFRTLIERDSTDNAISVAHRD